jgi:hypothetical protein
MIRTVTALRYVTPLREGGSLPAIVEADDGALYAMKFRGAGQGVKPLIAELLAGEIARTLGLLVPEVVFMELDPALGRSERDPEIQDLIKASGGLNLGLAYLSGALTYSPLLATPSPEAASTIVWFDALVTNVDRTPRNTNLLRWQGDLWLIDHGAAFYFHHAGWDNYLERSRAPFPQIKDHVLLPYATLVEDLDAALAAALPPDVIGRIASHIPESWLDEPAFATPDEHRAAYAAYLAARLGAPRRFVQDIAHARAARL